MKEHFKNPRSSKKYAYFILPALFIFILGFITCLSPYDIPNMTKVISPINERCCPDVTTQDTKVIDKNSADIQNTSDSPGIPLPIIMYHSLLKHPDPQNKYIIQPKLFEKDLRYISENGYTTIMISDLIAYVEKGTPLPEKPVILTFDDGYYNNYYYAYPLLRQYNMKAVISIVGKYTDILSIQDQNHISYSNLTWHQVDELQNSGYVEIQNHTYDMHYNNNRIKGVLKKSLQSSKKYRKILKNDIGMFQEKIYSKIGYTPTAFVYPYGFYTHESEEIIKDMGFQASLCCDEGTNYITKDPESLFLMKRYLRSSNIDISRILAPSH